MNIVTITPDAQKAISNLINKTVLVEYDMILGYPRIIDHIVNFEKISDQQLINDITYLGKASLAHFEKTDNILARFGSQKEWQAKMLPRLFGIAEEMGKQLEKERFARDTYREASKIASNNRRVIRGREFFGKTFRIRAGVDEELISADEIVETLDRLAMDEERHMRIAEDSLAAFKALSQRRGNAIRP